MWSLLLTSFLLDWDGENLNFEMKNNLGVRALSGSLGINIPGTPVQGNCTDLCYKWEGLAELAVTNSEYDNCVEIFWKSEHLSSIEDCLDIGEEYWYGGPEELIQHFPLRKENPRHSVPYLPGDMIQDKDQYFGGVAEPYWLNSKGGAIWVEKEQPLFYSWNQNNSSKLCLASKKSLPYRMKVDDTLELSYTLCAGENAKEMQTYAAANFWGRPETIPDERMITSPIWSTWAQYKAEINESIVMEFANNIISNGFDNSQLEIDDKWEACYGDAKFDLTKFPDPARLVTNLKAKGFRVTLWIHPFVNLECESFGIATNPTSVYVVRDPKGKFGDFTGELPVSKYLPGLTWWWQGFAAGYIDFTNTDAVDWWTIRLNTLRTEFGIDSFKFDAGEYNWLPTSYYFQNETSQNSPGIFTTRYAEAISKFGNMIELRVGRHSQHIPRFVRMLDKFSVWGFENGLKSMVTTLLQFGIVGYPFILPDMIGGNGYGNLPSRELYIRWLQVNVFMPAVQISFVPWMFDDEVVEHARDMMNLHAQYAPTIIQLATQATKTGIPINRPVWWLDPTDDQALAIDSEFLLGDDILVAPVMDEGAVDRDVYLPVGVWRDANTDEIIEGPTWIFKYPAHLYTLPYFIRI